MKLDNFQLNVSGFSFGCFDVSLRKRGSNKLKEGFMGRRMSSEIETYSAAVKQASP